MSFDDIKFRVALPTDREKILQFLRRHYYLEEPLTIGSEPMKQDAEDEKFTLSNIKHGMSMIAYQVSGGNEKIVGAVLTGPKMSDEAELLFKEAEKLGPTKWGKTVKFLACIERDANVFKRFGIKKALHVHVLAVDERLRGKAIGVRLMLGVKRIGRDNGFELLTADCSSYYSARLLDRLGMICVHKVYYKDYKDKFGNPVFCPPAPHESINTLALELKESK